jgi:hypothetical protein
MTFIKGIAIAAAIAVGLSASAAQAGYVVDITQQGNNVVASGSGALDLTGLILVAAGGARSQMSPGSGIIITGPTSLTADYEYLGAVTGPPDFGPGVEAFPNSGGGDIVGIVKQSGDRGELYAPSGYVSGNSLSDSSTYDGQTFASLGVTPGTYKWTWGTGANQNFTLVIGTAVPEPSSWAMMLIGFAGLGFTGYQSATRRRRTAMSPGD